MFARRAVTRGHSRSRMRSSTLRSIVSWPADLASNRAGAMARIASTATAVHVDGIKTIKKLGSAFA